MEIPVSGINSGHSTEGHSATQPFESDLSEVTGVLLKAGKNGEEISNLGIEPKKKKRKSQNLLCGTIMHNDMNSRLLGLTRKHFSLREDDVHITTNIYFVIVVRTTR